MNILVSAYACDPYRGSEPGVGWAAVCRIARNHQVFVLTDDHNRAGWERAATEQLIPSGVQVRFLRHCKPCSQNRFVAHLQSWLSYAAFNRLVLEAAGQWHREISFDLCHQITIAAWRMPSPLWRLPIPFVWGPIGGAGYIPHAFRSMLSPAARLFELARDFNTLVSSRSRAFLDCIHHTAVVIAANEETEEFLKPFRQDRPLVRLPIASLSADKVLQFNRPTVAAPTSGPLRLFAGGNMEGRKGVDLALRALALVASKGVDFHYTVAGGGPEIPALRSLAAQLKISDKVDFHPGFHGDDYLRALWSSEIYFLPSFRESTPVTLLEACLAGCYPVVADTSAQGEIVRMTGGSAVSVTTMDELVRGLAEALLWCHTQRQDLGILAANTIPILAQYFAAERYDRVVEAAYQSALSPTK